MECPKCGYETNSDKVYWIHVENCNAQSVVKDFENMDWIELKKYATEKGINTYKKGKEEIIKSLKELGES